MQPSPLEQQFSSSIAKLLYHATRLQHPLYPITLHLALTDACNLDCVFCSVKNRGRQSLSTQQIFEVVSHPIFGQLAGVELTGGGEPTLHPEIEPIIRILSSRQLRLGLITNGTMLARRLQPETMALLTWIRVSLNSLDYVAEIDLTTIPNGPLLGFSYVLNEHTTPAIIATVADYADRHKAAYVRIVPDCLAPADQLAAMPSLPLDHPKFYLQSKAFRSLTSVSPCRIGYLKPYLNTDGYFYWCSGVCLEEQKFTAKYRMGHWTAIEAIWQNQQPFDCMFDKCFWVEHNQLLAMANTPIMHPYFI